MEARNKSDELALKQGCYYDESAPAKVRQFAETFCTLQDGDRAGKPATFLNWAYRDIVQPLYGWKRKDGTRRFRRGSIWTPRKCAKTTTLSILGLWQLLEEPAAQVYIVSSTVECASHLFNYAAAMVENNPQLSKRLWCRRNLKVIEDKSKGSILKVLSGDKMGKSGHNASCVLWDELAEIKDNEIWYRLYDSGMARKQSVWISISTPQYDRQSLAWAQWQHAYGVQNSTIIDTEYLGVVWGVPPDVDYTQPDNWWRYIPALGETVTKEYYLNEWEKVKDNPRELCRFRNLLLAQWTENLKGWLPLDKWQECLVDVDEATLEGQSCFVGVDGSINSCSAYLMWFPETKTVIPRFFCPRDTANKSDAKNLSTYKAWAESGYITLTQGDLFDWDAMSNSLIRDSKKFNFIKVAFDPYSLEGRLIELKEKLCCDIVAVEPTRNVVSPPTQHLERLVIGKELQIQNNPVLTWNAKNAAVKMDAHDRIALDRDSCGGRYDGIAAFVLALQPYLIDGWQEDFFLPVLL